MFIDLCRHFGPCKISERAARNGKHELLRRTLPSLLALGVVAGNEGFDRNRNPHVMPSTIPVMLYSNSKPKNPLFIPGSQEARFQPGCSKPLEDQGIRRAGLGDLDPRRPSRSRDLPGALKEDTVELASLVSRLLRQ